MKVTIYNREKTLLGDSQDEVLGEFSVQVCSLTTFCDKPQYFSVYNEDGQFIGQILANFHVRYFQKDPKTKRMKGAQGDPEHDKLKEAFEKPLQIRYEGVTVRFSVFGLRNLRKEAKKPWIEVKLTNGERRDDGGEK